MAAYEKPEAGEWVQPVRRGYKLACCDCGLVHTVDVRVRAGRVQFRAFRNERSTSLLRRWNRKRGETDMRHVQTTGTCPPLSDNTQRRPPKKGKK